jgi:hypothetical protein
MLVGNINLRTTFLEKPALPRKHQQGNIFRATVFPDNQHSQEDNILTVTACMTTR